ncbi:MAG TPA: PPC domain-containing protein [Candidatus Thermoplasmatota archaeon]|nr:PPC domain-containing protein [Candidatus Thermoplasmatota archaeon]
MPGLPMTTRALTLSILIITSVLAVLVPAPAIAQATPAACPATSAPAALEAGVPLAGNDASAGTLAADLATGDCHFTFAVPGGPAANAGKELLVTVSAAESHSMAIKRGTAPAVASPYVCSAAASTAASCKVFWPLTQPNYSLRVGRSVAGASDFSITVTVVDAPASGCPNGYAITDLTDAVAQSVTLGQASGSRCYFKFQPSSAADLAKVVATGMPSSLGSYVLWRENDVPVPTTVPGTPASADYACAPLTGTTRTCATDIPTVGPAWYGLLIRGTTITTTATPFTITASSISSCSLGRGYHPIAAGDIVSTATLGLDAGSKCDFLLTPSQVESLDRFTLTPGAANADVYVYKLATPDQQPIPRTGFVCSAASTVLTTNDVCAAGHETNPQILATVYRPAAGTAATGFTLKAEAVEGCSLGSAPTDLLDNTPVAAALTNDFDASCRFHFAPNPLEATARLATGVAPTGATYGLFVKRGSPPTTALGGADCTATVTATAAGTCDFPNTGGDIYGLLRRTSGSGPVSVYSRAFSPCAFDDLSPGGGRHLLSEGVPVTGTLTADVGGSCQFRFDVPATQDGASLALTPGPDADFDLYVKLGSAPTTGSYDCRSNSLGNGTPESCMLALGAGSYYAIVQRVGGSGAWALTATGINTCSLGPLPTDLAAGVAKAGSLLGIPGAKCYFAFTPGNPLADPYAPANDIVKVALSTDAANNFDLYLRKGAVPSTTTYDCASVLAAGSADACERIVPDGSTYYAMVRRVAGGGDFAVTATTSHSCALGPGYHSLPNGQEVQGATRAVAGSTKCYFSLPSLARDDLLSVVQEARTANTGYTLALSRDVPIGAGPAECTGSSSWIYFPSFGININTLAQCDRLLEDGLAHHWYVSVSRTASAGAADIAFAVKGTAQQIPTLVAGVPQVGHVDTGSVQYWKVVVPRDATFLDVQTAGDMSSLACGTLAPLNSNAALACALLPFPKLVGCAVAAGYGVSCDQAEKTLAQRCIEETGDAATCGQIEAARLEACAQANTVNPGSCVPSDSSGSVSGTCGIINRQTGDTTCDPLGASVKTTEMDLLVRYRTGLPKSSAYDCRSATPGATERCLFSDQVKEIHDGPITDVRANATSLLADLLLAANGNRTLLDQAVADLRQAIAENRTDVIEPLWATIRLTIFDATGQDPGALPATPSATVPATPNPAVPDPVTAQPMPGAGKYFIAVRGPLDAASALYYQGGDYAIVALHDNVTLPDRQAIDDQVAAALGGLDQSLAQRCAVNALLQPVCILVAEVLATLCAAVPFITPEGCAHLDGSLAGGCWLVASTGQELCPAIAVPDAPCPPFTTPEGCAHLDGSPEGACWFVANVLGEDACADLPAPLPVPAPPAPPAPPEPGSDPGDVVADLVTDVLGLLP